MIKIDGQSDRQKRRTENGANLLAEVGPNNAQKKV